MLKLLPLPVATKRRWASKVAQAKAYAIVPWQSAHDCTSFCSGMEAIDRYIKNQASRDMSSHASLVFVLTETGSNVVRAYYALSALGIVFAALPEKAQKKLPRYPQIGATLLGRLGVDRNFKAAEQQRLGENPRLGELLFVHAQKTALSGAKTTAGSTMLVIDVKQPSAAESEAGVRDPMDFYTQYGYAPFPGNARRVFKLMRVIEQEQV
jgi:hypothetical protein